MVLTDAEIASIIAVLVVLGNAFAIYLSHQSTGKNIDDVQASVDAVASAVQAKPVSLTAVTGTSTGQPPALVDGHATPPVQPLPPRG